MKSDRENQTNGAAFPFRRCVFMTCKYNTCKGRIESIIHVQASMHGFVQIVAITGAPRALK